MQLREISKCSSPESFCSEELVSETAFPSVNFAFDLQCISPNRNDHFNYHMDFDGST